MKSKPIRSKSHPARGQQSREPLAIIRMTTPNPDADDAIIADVEEAHDLVDELFEDAPPGTMLVLQVPPGGWSGGDEDEDPEDEDPEDDDPEDDDPEDEDPEDDDPEDDDPEDEFDPEGEDDDPEDEFDPEGEEDPSEDDDDE